MGLKMQKGALVLLLVVATILLVSASPQEEEVGGNGLKDDKHLFFFKPFFKHGILLGKRLGFKYGHFVKRLHGLGKGFGPFGGVPFVAGAGAGAGPGAGAGGGASLFPSSNNNGFGRKVGKVGGGGL